MKRTFGIVTATAMALALTGCEFSFGGPSLEDIEQSIVENYEGEGYENIAVSLEETEEGGYIGEVEYTVPQQNDVQRTLECSVEPVENNEASWRCYPRVNDLAQMIVDGYEERGAQEVYAELTSESDTSYTGHVDYTNPQTGQRNRHDCTVDLADGDANWQCAP
ncbi:hypothetical protein [Parasphingopyxis sp.]|uniref:hypothetical protein n=1 Tax=Parasphingopyxis sp. TaxID=1920299 RepID=UPI002637F273|nr:hypothetical protein [Parasphingopyxis sp.]